MPFEGPYKEVGDRKDQFGNKVKNVAKHLAKKAMNKQKNEEIDPDLETELKATRVTKKSIADSQKTRERASRMKEDSEHTNCGTPECCGECDTVEQIDEISAKTAVNAYAKRNAKAFNDGQYDDEAEKDYNKLDKQGDRIQKKFGAKIVQKAQKAASKKIFGEEVEELDEVSKATLGRYINKAKDSIDTASYRQGHKEAHGSSSKPLEKKLSKRHKGIETAVGKLTKEESEQIDELSKATLGSYVKKATNQAFSRGFSGGAMTVRGDMNRDSEEEKAGEKNVHKAIKRVSGVTKAVNKLTKEEQDFIDSLNDADLEQIDELSKKTVSSYLDKSEPRLKDYAHPQVIKRHKSAKTARSKLGLPTGSNRGGYGRATTYHTPRVTATEETEITEARGRPRKAGAKDFTIHPKTKEKLMHNNPADMARIERLQKNGILEKPKVEAGQHIMNQLSKAKTSMLGGSTIHFTHGDSKHVSGTHAAKLLSKYAGMKPNEKEDFQKKIGHSHEQLMKHV